MRSIYDNVTLGGVAGPAVNATASSVVATGASVDTKGYNTGVIRVYTSAIAGGIPAATPVTLVAVLQESSDNSNWATANDNTGTAIGFTQTATTTAVIGSARVEGLQLNRKRYLRVTLQGGGYATALTAFAVVELGRAYSNPVNSAVSNT